MEISGIRINKEKKRILIPQKSTQLICIQNLLDLVNHAIYHRQAKKKKVKNQKKYSNNRKLTNSEAATSTATASGPRPT